MNITSIINNEFVEPLEVLLYSLSETQRDNINFYLIYYNLQEHELNRLKKFCTAININFFSIKFPDNIYKKLLQLKPQYVDNRFYPLEVYFRLFLPSLLPSFIRKVLYLDADTYIQKNLRLFYDVNLDNLFFSAVLDPVVYEKNLISLKQEFFQRINVPEDFLFVNTGVLLMNLENLRRTERFTETQILEIIKNNLELNDQDIINKYFHDMIFILFNVNFNRNPELEGPSLSEAYILHYMQRKPWNDEITLDYSFYSMASFKWLQIRQKVDSLNKVLM